MDKFMQTALDEAYSGINSGHGGPFGSVVVKDGKIVGQGHNCVVKNNDPTAHGEVMAIRNACENLGTFSLKDCVIYTTAEPCPMCLGAILWAGIEKVYYGCDVTDTEKINFSDKEFYDAIQNGMGEKMEQIDRIECQKLFEDYSKLKNKTAY